MRNLAGIADKVVVAEGNIVTRIAALAGYGPFDLVMAGGLFDYLTDKQIVFLIRNIFKRLLAEGGRFVFTNLATGNPFRHWIEYFGNWMIVERSEKQIRELIRQATDDTAEVSITRDGTGLTLLVEAARRREVGGA